MQSNKLRKLLGASLFVVTAGAVAGYDQLAGLEHKLFPQDPQPTPVVVAPVAQDIEVVFAIDTTGSMGGLLEAAKEKVWSIATTMASSKPAPNIKMGLVAYRDRGDAYVTKVFDLSSDLDSVYAELMEFQAQGGGDGPESVNKALSDAVHQMSWGQSQNAYRVVFLVGDAPAHMDYGNEAQYPQLVKQASARGILINTIRCGGDQKTAQQWQQIAALGQGSYFTVDQNGSALAINSPFDKRLAQLSAELDGTRLGYGDAASKAKAELKEAATSKLHSFSSAASQARRAAFNALDAGAKNLFGDSDLLVDISEGEVRLEEVTEAQLPNAIAKLAPAERQAAVAEIAGKRKKLQAEIQALSGRRDTYLADQAAAAPAASSSLDYKILESVKQQTKDKGLVYEDVPRM